MQSEFDEYDYEYDEGAAGGIQGGMAPWSPLEGEVPITPMASRRYDFTLAILSHTHLHALLSHTRAHTAA